MAWYKLIQEFYFNAPVKIAALFVSHLYVYDMGYRSSENTHRWLSSQPAQQYYAKPPTLSVADDENTHRWPSNQPAQQYYAKPPTLSVADDE